MRPVQARSLSAFRKLNLLPLGAHYRATLHLGFPLVVAQLGQIALGFADSAMIGHYGMPELAAASFCINLFTLPIVIIMGYSLGLIPMMGQRYGRGDRLGAGAIFRVGLWSNLRFGLLLTLLMGVVYLNLDRLGQPEELLPYIRPYFLLQLVSLPVVSLFSALKQVSDAIGRTAVSMWVMLIGNALNVLANLVLIYGLWGFPEWGLAGAGMATLISRVFMALALLAILAQHPGVVRERLGFFRRQMAFRPAWREVVRTSSFISLQMGLEAGMFSLSIYMIGWLGSVALAAHHVAITVQSIGFMTYYGLAAATSIRVSHYWGQKRYGEARHAALAGFHTVLLAALGMIAIMVFFRGPLAAIFTDDLEVLALADLLLLAAIAYQPADTLQITYSNALRGAGETRSLAWVAFIGYFVVGLPLGYILAFPCGLGAVGVWWAFPVGLGLAGIGYALRFRRRVKLALG